MLLPVSYAKNTLPDAIGLKVLAGDVGGTKTSLGLFEMEDTLKLIKTETYQTKSYADITVMLDKFLGNDVLHDICLGVAGPVDNGAVKMTNLEHEIKASTISGHFHHVPATLINDLEATAYGLNLLDEHDLAFINKGQPKDGNIAIIAPGTGLGEAGLYWDGQTHHPFATEGGHSDFFPRGETDIALYRFLQSQFGHVSWERVLSGPGIYNIYQFLKIGEKMDEPEWLAKRLQTENPAAVISEIADNNEALICTRTIELFFQYLAAESASLVLKLKAVGGLYIGGGILPKIQSLLNKDNFIKAFYECGRLSRLLQDVPIKLILNDKTALLGAAYFAVYGKRVKLGN